MQVKQARGKLGVAVKRVETFQRQVDDYRLQLAVQDRFRDSKRVELDEVRAI